MFFKNIVFSKFLFCSFGSILLFPTILSERKCGNEKWAQFKNEKCIILVEAPLTQSEAKELCRLEPHSNGKSHLITISSVEELDFIGEYLFKLKVKDSIWIDMIRVNDTNPIFHNSYYEEQEYFNWAVDKPSTDLKKKCVQMKPSTEGMVSPLRGKGIISGKWEDVLCSRKNLVLCEKPIEWDPLYLQRAVIRGQKQLDSLKYQLRDLNKKTEEMSTEKLKEVDNRLDVVINKLEEFDSQMIQIVSQTNSSKKPVDSQNLLVQNKQSTVPIGFIYMQLPGQSEPKSLWPEFVWKDISEKYAGLFFRVQGKGSSPFLQIQPENSPRLIAVSSQSRKLGNTKHNKDELESNDKWSKEVLSGYGPPDGTDKKNLSLQYLSFKISSGEVRPTNTAIVVWQRIE